MSSGGLAQAWTIARRDLRGRFRGLRLLVVCLFLGVATLAAIGSLTASITGELADRGQIILGGDLEVGISQRDANTDELAALNALGSTSTTVRMQAMANMPDGSDNLLSELKGVDDLYPLYGDFLIEGQGKAAPLGINEIYVTPAFAERLSVKLGDNIRFGNAEFSIKAIIEDEPDRLSEGFTLGPVAIISMDAMERTGLVQPGSLYESKYRIKLPNSADPETVAEELNTQFPNAGWEMKNRDNGAPGTTRFIDRMGQFLTLVGLAALVIAGIGVGNGVSSYLATKRGSIATLKVVGAQSSTIFQIYLLQILAVAAIAIVAGLIVGAVTPLAIISIAGDVLPVEPGFTLHPLPLAISAIYGLLIAFIFALPPLARARLVPAAGLFRGGVEALRQIDKRTIIAILVAIGLIIALAVGTSSTPVFSAGFVGMAIAMLAFLTFLGWAIGKIARRVPRPRQPLLRLALTNLHRPGAQTSQLVVALGLGLTLFVTLAAIQTSINNEVTNSVPKEAPSFFVLDIPLEDGDRFTKLVTDTAPNAVLNKVPALRGTITAFGGQRVDELEELPEGAWVLNGDRGLTYSDIVPEGSEVVKGKWWDAGYSGKPLVSLDEEVAKSLSVDVGDTMVVSLLGVEVEAEIASLREIHWENFGFNYVMVFSPGAFGAAPHNLVSTITVDKAAEDKLSKILPREFPSISMIEVKEVVSQISTLLGQMSTAIAAAASIAILSGIAVLVGAIAASRQSRIYDSVLLKLLGATRPQILFAQAVEYTLLAIILAAVALGLGLFAGWYVVTQVFEFGWAPDWGILYATLAAGALMTLGLGLIGSWPILSARPARALRSL